MIYTAISCHVCDLYCGGLSCMWNTLSRAIIKAVCTVIGCHTCAKYCHALSYMRNIPWCAVIQAVFTVMSSHTCDSYCREALASLTLELVVEALNAIVGGDVQQPSHHPKGIGPQVNGSPPQPNILLEAL